MKSKLDWYLEFIKENEILYENVTNILLIENTNQDWGFLYVSQDGENLDNHCEQCQEEQPSWFCLKESEIFPFKYLSAEIGYTKYNKILNGKIKLDNVKIIKDLTYLIEN